MNASRQSTSPTDRTVPDVEPGLTVLQTEHHHSGAVHSVARRAIQQTNGPVYWLDARNTASTYALHELFSNDRALDRIQIARAFTAYQHYSLAEDVLNRISPRAGCLIVPNLASLYRDDDVPGYDSEALLEAAATALAELGRAYEIPVLASLGGPADSSAGLVTEPADTVITAERTSLGYRFEGPDFETDVYWADSYWQTTIPYWVDLLGAAEESQEQSLTGPTVQAALEG